MALKSTIFKAELQVSDLDRAHYGQYSLTLARHPSETDERLMMRLLAFALHAHEQLTFGGGVSTEEEPALWQKDLTGAIELWIEVGTPDEKRLKKACNRAPRVVLLSYGRAWSVWWRDNEAALKKLSNLEVWAINPEQSQALAQLAQRNMNLCVTIQEQQIWFASDSQSEHITPTRLQGSSDA